MKKNDVSTLMLVVYVLLALFLFTIYAQSLIFSSPESLTALEAFKSEQYANLTPQEVTSQIQGNGHAAINTLFALTAFFGFAWVMTRSRTS